jgi:hypothetical protein
MTDQLSVFFRSFFRADVKRLDAVLNRGLIVVAPIADPSPDLEGIRLALVNPIQILPISEQIVRGKG